jgi:glycosyltransferase involved in cell wall biosynthesis
MSAIPGPSTSAATEPGSAGGRRLRVFAFTPGRDVPSARFRVRQYIAPLARLGIDVDERYPRASAYPPRLRSLRPPWAALSLAQRLPAIAASHGSDVTLLQREFISTYGTLERFSRAPRVLDVDDAFHLARGGVAARHLARLSRLVICGNAWLAEVYASWGVEVAVLPTAIDLDMTTQATAPTAPSWDRGGEGARLAWIGTSGNLTYLDSIAAALAAVLARWPRLRLAVCCDARPRLAGVPMDRVDFTEWSVESERSFFNGPAIGLMPLADGPWERGKCSFKMLQYLAAGWPCVVSPVGMNTEVLAAGKVGYAASTLAEWTEALDALLSDPTTAAAIGSAGRSLVAARFSVTALAPRLGELLRRAAG